MAKNNNKLRICRIATVPIALLGHRHQFEELSEMGVDLTVVCSKGKGFENLPHNDSINLHSIEIKREISPLNDLISIVNLFLFFKNNNFDIVHSNTPKAGVLVSIASWLAAVPIRLHTFTGQRWVSLKGFKRSLLIICDKLISTLNTHSFTDSHSQRDFLINSGILKADNSSCLGKGSFSGINLEKFKPTDDHSGATKKELEIKENDFVLGYIGRMVKDKGIDDLVQIFQEIKKVHKNVKLILVGPEETEVDLIQESTKEIIKNDSDIITTGHVSDPEKYLNVMNLFILPSLREGFPTVILEANALKVPAVASDIVGTKDTIIDGKTGYLTPVKDNKAMKERILFFIENSQLCQEIGEAAFQRVLKDFSSKKISSLLASSYLKLKRYSHA